VSAAGGLLALLSLLLASAGCQGDAGCVADGTACGGDPTGTWTVTGACRDPAFAAPQQTTYQSQPVAVARQPAPVTTSSDWCSMLVFGAQGLASFVFPHDTLAVSGGQVTYAGDGTFQAVIDTAGPGRIDLSASCLTRVGASATCDVVAAALADLAAAPGGQAPGIPCTDSPAEPSSCRYYYTYASVACAGDASGGCACTYDVSFAGTFTGRWTAAGDRLVHFDATRTLPSQADYCVDGAGAALSLWGHDRTALFDEPGIRTLHLQRVP
jgi:hypothetical protein